MDAPRKPDFHVAIMDKATDQKNNRVGGGWMNDDGSIYIRLNYGIVLDGRNPNLVITLFPRDEFRESGQ